MRPPTIHTGRLWRGLRVGLLGGSFNPAHDGHRHVSLQALKRLRLDAVWWLVSPQNPLKPRAGMATLAARCARAETVARHPRVVVSALEVALGTTRTADTLAHLRRRFPGVRFVWLMGADNLLQIPRWQRWSTIFHSAAIAVFARDSYSLPSLGGQAAKRYARRRHSPRRINQLNGPPPGWVFLRVPLHPASATALRRSGAWAANGTGDDRLPGPQDRLNGLR